MTVGNNAGKRAPSTPPVPPTTTIHVMRLTMPGIRALCVLAALVAPGLLIGAAIAYRFWHRLRPQPSGRWASAIGVAVLGGLFVPVIVWLWPLRLLFGLLPPGGNIVVSVIGEALWGPLVLQAILHFTIYEQHPPRMQGMHQSTPAGQGTPTSPTSSPPTSPMPSAVSWAHPKGFIRLGADPSNQPFDLALNEALNELKQHVFIPGLPGTGKTTTLTRLMDGAMANGYGVVIVDFKGGGLRLDAERVARAHKRTTYIVSPNAPDSLGYNPCTGHGYSVANKIIGALSFGSDAGIYKDVGKGVISPIVNAMRDVGQLVTFDTLWQNLQDADLTRLSTALGKVTGLAEVQTRVDDLNYIREEKGTLAAGREGLGHRLLAFRHGAFGALLRKDPALVWSDVLAQPSVAYLEVPALGADEDVKLLGLVLIQDLKEVAKERIEAQMRREKVFPILLIIDEFAALKDAGQIEDLLRQGRAAQMVIVVATQHLPEKAEMRKVVVGSDLLLVHRVQVEDADMLAKQVGTHATMETSVTTDDNRDPQAATPRQSTNVRRTEKFNVEPQDLANLQQGQIAVRSVARSASGWCGLVKVHEEISGP